MQAQGGVTVIVPHVAGAPVLGLHSGFCRGEGAPGSLLPLAAGLL